MNRNQLIAAAFRKVGVGAVDPAKLAQGIEHLNLVIQEEDARGASRQNRQLWATARDVVPLKAARQVYTTATVNNAFGIPTALVELEQVLYRDAGGEDRPVDILNVHQWQAIANKDEGGDPTVVWLEENKVLSEQRLWTHPTPATITDGDEVIGTDGLDYVCIQGHAATSPKRPTTGAQWPAFWAQKTAIGTASAWSASATYVHAPALVLTYKRPLTTFVNATDNPDMPVAWERFLIYRLAHELASDFGVTLEERQALKDEFEEARDLLFPGTRPKSDVTHNRGCFF
jgi:hypothetical protein